MDTLWPKLTFLLLHRCPQREEAGQTMMELALLIAAVSIVLGGLVFTMANGIVADALNHSWNTFQSLASGSGS